MSDILERVRKIVIEHLDADPEKLAELQAMLAPLGLKLPVYPVKGYSITVPVLVLCLAGDEGLPAAAEFARKLKLAMLELESAMDIAGEIADNMEKEISGARDAL